MVLNTVLQVQDERRITTQYIEMNAEPNIMSPKDMHLIANCVTSNCVTTVKSWWGSSIMMIQLFQP